MDYLTAFEKLRLETPRLALHNVNSENSAYCSHAVKNKNCYLSHGSVDNEDCLYCTTAYSGNKDCVDCFIVNLCELCYECTDCVRCYNGSFLQDCIDCADSTLCFDCIGCRDCFGCVGLRQKKFYIFNQPYSPEEYRKNFAKFLSVGLYRASYRILNQQYSEAEYRRRVAMIKEEMRRSGEYGKFFRSVFPYEDSKAMDFYPRMSITPSTTTVRRKTSANLS